MPIVLLSHYIHCLFVKMVKQKQLNKSISHDFKGLRTVERTISEKNNRISILSQDNLKLKGERDDLKNVVKHLKITNENNLKEFRKMGAERDNFLSRIDVLVEEKERKSERKTEEMKQCETEIVANTEKKKTVVHKKLSQFKEPDNLIICNSNGSGLRSNLLKPDFSI